MAGLNNQLISSRATSGEKSIPLLAGSMRRIGPNNGSVTLYTNHSSCRTRGLGAPGLIHDMITRTKIRITYTCRNISTLRARTGNQIPPTLYRIHLLAVVAILRLPHVLHIYIVRGKEQDPSSNPLHLAVNRIDHARQEIDDARAGLTGRAFEV